MDKKEMREFLDEQPKDKLFQLKTRRGMKQMKQIIQIWNRSCGDCKKLIAQNPSKMGYEKFCDKCKEMIKDVEENR